MTASHSHASSSPPQDAPLSGGALFLAAILLASANFIAVLDMTIANVSVHSIAGSLGISASQGTWIITSYAVAEAIIVPLTGWIAGRFGAVRVFTSAMVLFGIFSALCGFSNSLAMLVFCRVMQGLSGGLLMPLSQTLLMRIFPRDQAPKAMALWAMTTLVAPVLGPILGGWLCDNFSWPLIFFINVPIAAACAPVAWRILKRYETRTVRAPIDLVGLALLITFVGSLQIMLDIGKDHEWFASTEICALAIISAVGFVAFIIWELTEKHPIVNLRVFRHRGFTAAVVTLSLGYGAMFGANVLTPLWLQSYMGYTSTWAGLAIAWSGVFAIFCAPVAGKLMTKVDPRWLVFVGLVWLAVIVGSRMFATNQMTYWQVAFPLLLMGFGLPFFIVPLTALGLGSVEEDETAAGAGLQNFLRTLSGAVATSLVTTIWEDKTNYIHADLAGVSDRNAETLSAMVANGASQEEARIVLDHMVTGQSVMIATNQLMFIAALAFAIAALVIWFAPKPARAVDMTQAGH